MLQIDLLTEITTKLTLERLQHHDVLTLINIVAQRSTSEFLRLNVKCDKRLAFCKTVTITSQTNRVKQMSKDVAVLS